MSRRVKGVLLLAAFPTVIGAVMGFLNPNSSILEGMLFVWLCFLGMIACTTVLILAFLLIAYAFDLIFEG